MQTWLSLDEFSKLIGKSPLEVETLCQNGELTYKTENDEIFIEASVGTKALVPTQTDIQQEGSPNGSLMEKTIGTILNLHEKVLRSRDDLIENLKSENEFLKESVYSMQEVYEEDRKTIETLQKQLKIAQEELEFMRRKYKLMWGKVIKGKDGDE